MKILNEPVRVAEVMRTVRFLVAASLGVILLLSLSSPGVRADTPIVVGNGTPASCTSDAFSQAVASAPAGATITFNCGPNPVTIWSGDLEIYKDLTIDGGGLITFTGYGPFYIGAGTVLLMNLAVTGASADVGGAIDNRATLTLRHVTLANNDAGHGTGGGGVSNGGTLTVQDSTIIGNNGGCDLVQCGRGGGILNGGTLRVINSTISGNRANDGGGGIFNQGTAIIQDSTIANNTSGCIYYGADVECFPGGGIWNSATMQILNTTISENVAGSSGGGLENIGTVTIQNSTIAKNSAPSGGGLMNHASAAIQNSILAGNSETGNLPSDCSGTLTSGGYNLVQTTAGCAITGDTTGNLLGLDPLLGPLQANGGPTFTHALLPGSPAIDAGSPAAPGSGGAACERTDQRGVARPQDGNGDGVARCDIGAVELLPAVLAVPVDIKPGDSTNPVNLKSKGVIPVAILSTATFDARSVVPSSVKFGPNGASSVSTSLADVNGDGRLDLVLHFRTQQSGIQPDDTQACLVGKTRGGAPLKGCDTIRVVP